MVQCKCCCVCNLLITWCPWMVQAHSGDTVEVLSITFLLLRSDAVAPEQLVEYIVTFLTSISVIRAYTRHL